MPPDGYDIGLQMLLWSGFAAVLCGMGYFMRQEAKAEANEKKFWRKLREQRRVDQEAKS